MTDLNLAELSRLEKIVHKKGLLHFDSGQQVDAYLDSIRPLLDLVDRLGIALTDAEEDFETFGDEGHIQDITQQHDPQICDICFANEAAARTHTALDDYQRAKGE